MARIQRLFSALTSCWAEKPKPAKCEDRDYFFPIKYRYDCLDGIADQINLPQLKLNRWLCNARSSSGLSTAQHTVDILPQPVDFPHRTAFSVVKQSKYCESLLQVNMDALDLMAQDSTVLASAKQQMTLAEVAGNLRKKVEDDFMKFSIYLYPRADPERAALIAISLVYIFVFDDFQEMRDSEEVPRLQQTFVSRLVGEKNECSSTTPLQIFFDESINGLRHHADTGGQDVLQFMVEFFLNPRPPQETFSNLREFLMYRREDAAVKYVMAATKFSIGCTVDLGNPRLARLMGLFYDHIVYVNDLASYDKELKAYVKGEVKCLVNAVHTAQQLLSLPDGRRAKLVIYQLQLAVESDIDEEIVRLRTENQLDSEHWRFIHASLETLSGHVLTGHVMRRYGGEQCRLNTPLTW
ncbi:isoprenoid synthase domain-containing protein [Xylariales sp. AK1849]|nr:isoprenoid synthase domain-containing protein [Xylariales sp. AK1849]